MNLNFQYKVVLITGGSSGIGQATAVAFAQEGARVVVAARRAKEGNETVEMVKAVGGEASFIQTDVSQTAAVKAMVEHCITTYGGLDFAFNNASIEGSAHVSTADYEDTFGIKSSTYVASKHGVVGATKAAARECANQGIRVNVVCPAVSRTPMADRAFGEDEESIHEQGSWRRMGRVGTPDEVASAVLWLCSDGAGFVTGHALAIDGGMLI